MKKVIYVACSLLFVAGIAACGGQKEGETAQTHSETAQNEVSDEPYADSSLESSSTAQLGGHTYVVKVNRVSDKQLPVVEDELGKKFYDNRVDVTVTRDGQEFFSRSYTKEAFADFLSAAESRGTVLLGMAYDSEKSDSRAICLGAQIGEVGIGEGPVFTVEIPLDGSASGIVRDSEQDTTGDEGFTD